MDYSQAASQESIDKAVAALKANGIDVHIVENAEEAKSKVAELIPAGSEVMNMTSVTLEESGIVSELNDSGKYDSLKTKLAAMDPSEESLKRKMGAGPDYAIGSVHAITEDGKVVIASNTGSQLPAYAYGAKQVVWVVGAQKIVPDLDTAFDRIYNHTLPLESERARKAYGVDGSFVSKLLIFNREKPGRISIVLIKQAIGY